MVEREWKRGDIVQLDLDMPVRMILPDPREKDNAGQAVLARGPLIYCLEKPDAPFPLDAVRWDLSPAEAARAVHVKWEPGLLGGINTLLAPGVVGAGASAKRVELKLIPYYARANRSDNNRWVTFIPLGGASPLGSR